MNMVTRFLPWVRRQSFAGDSLIVRASGRDVPVPIFRYGPGDVSGIAPGQIRRRDPLPGALSMPPNLFPFVEFTAVDFPWALSPVEPNAAGQLQPWLALIVVDAQSGNPLGNVAGSKLPVIEVSRNELPDVTELSLWAHAQVSADAPATQDLISQGLSRVVSPRALAPKRRYFACLVPSFEAGRLAGLGLPVPDARSGVAAWTPGSGGVLLPVYDSWSFTTADSGDLETLARRLRGCNLSETSKPRQLDVTAVSGNVAGRVAPLEGALRPVDSSADWTGAAVASAATRIRSQLEHAPVNGVPVVGLPLYGSTASGQTKPVDGWLNDLNLDPRRRAAAGLGAAMVQMHQDDLVDEAWRQAGDIQRTRREREGALLADLVSSRINARMVAPLNGANALVAMAPSLGRTRDATGHPTLAARVASSVVPGPVLEAGFRRILNTKTPPLLRKAGYGLRRSVAQYNTLAVSPGTLPSTPPLLVTKAKVAQRMTFGLWELPLPPTIPPVTLPFFTGAPQGGSETPISRSSEAIGPQPSLLSTSVEPPPVSVVLSRSDLLTAFLAEFPARQPPVVNIAAPRALAWPATVSAAGTAVARFSTRITSATGAQLANSAGVAVTPRFTQPLAAWLDPSFLLAGIDIPQDAAGLLETNTALIEALMVGANHEFARELLWRGVPLGRTATPLTRFFESLVSTAPRDLTPIAEWLPAERLGSHFNFGEKCVMILRTPLVSRLNETAIFLAEAVPDGPYRKPGTTQKLPVFRGFAGLDTAYFGFDISAEDLASDPGWYFVIQELSGANRFGMDEVPTPVMTTWGDLAWPQVAVAGGYLAVSQKKPVPTQPRGLEWGKDAAHMASIMLQRPIRISIHTSLLLPPKES